MLTLLRIKNLALVPDLTLELAAGFNAITGETGAGKSIIIGALNLLLGERADRNSIRAGADSCSVEAVFALEKPVLERIDLVIKEAGLEPCEESHLVLKRIFTAAGSNKQFINGSPTTLAILSSLGEALVDMHGPHEHQSLLHVSRQVAILDAFGNLLPLREQVGQAFRKRAGLVEQKGTLIIDERTYAQQLDLLRFQVKEITQAALVPEEEQSLEADHARASNAARLLGLAQTALETLDGEESSLLSRGGQLGKTIQDLARIDPSAQTFTELHQQSIVTLQELQRELGQYIDSVELDPSRLAELESRLDLLQSLKRKYGSTIQDVIDFGSEAARKLHLLESRDQELAKINEQLGLAEKELASAGHELSSARAKVIPRLAKAVSAQLQDLGFRQSKFQVAISSASDGLTGITATGADQIEFLFAPNPGESERPLRSIASSGELARVMLALKTALASQDEIPVLVFDEVDANVGGETAAAVGQKMRQIGTKRQVLCITHLPPVAATARTHFVVVKETIGGRTVSGIRQIKGAERVSEIARMLGGQFEAARKHAETLLENANS